MEKQSYTGLWWEPGNENNPIPGTLLLDKVAKLRLIGEDFRAGGQRQNPPIPLLHGSTDEEGLITLVDLNFAGGGTRIPGLPYVERIASLVAIGDLFPDITSLRFDYVNVSFDHLDEWLGAWHFVGDPIDTGVKHKSPVELSISLTTLSANISFNYRVDFHDNRNSFEAVHHSFLKIAAPTPQTFEWFEHVIHELEGFLSLCIGIPIKGRNVQTTCNLRTITLIHGRRPVRPIHQIPGVVPPITHPMIKDHLEQILNEWFDQSPLIKRVFGIFQNSVVDPSEDSIGRFLRSVQLLEIYHRAKNGPNFSLVQRLRGLVEDLTTEEQALLTNDNSQFMQIVANTRNFLQHFNSNAIIFDNLDVYWATEILRTLTTIWLYREIGLAPDDVVRCIENHTDFIKEFDLNRLELFSSGQASISTEEGSIGVRTKYSTK